MNVPDLTQFADAFLEIFRAKQLNRLPVTLQPCAIESSPFRA